MSKKFSNDDDDVQGHMSYSDKELKEDVEPTSFDDQDEDTEAHAFKWSDATLKSEVEPTEFSEPEES